jgi:hypothetical protein
MASNATPKTRDTLGQASIFGRQLEQLLLEHEDDDCEEHEDEELDDVSDEPDEQLECEPCPEWEWEDGLSSEP